MTNNNTDQVLEIEEIDDDDSEWDELLERAWSIAKEEGRSFDHVMGELLANQC